MLQRSLLFALLVIAAGCKRAPVSYERAVNKNFHTQKVGASARNLLTSEHYQSLKIEIQYMSGYAPDEQAVENLKTFLDELIHKPMGIHVVTREIKPIADSVLSLDEVIALENANRKVYTDTSELSVYVLYTNGYFEKEKLIGYAYRNTSAVLFGKSIHQNSDTLGRMSRTELETRILQHEFGHLLGLTNVGTPMSAEHQDHDHGKHCTNKKCLMYYKTELTTYPSLIVKRERPTLDEQCRQDLYANGGKRNGYYYVSLKDIVARQ
jgi:predicted Zn-dependent protease